MRATFAPLGNILIADRDAHIAESVREYLETFGNIVATTTSGMEAKTLLLTGNYQILVADIDIPWTGGIELLEWSRKQPELMDLKVILTVPADTDKAILQRELTPAALLLHPLNPAALWAILQAQI